MATYTTNLNLKKPAQSDKIRIADINNNMDDIDAAFGAIGNDSVATQIGDIQGALAIVSVGDSHAAITAGQYVYVKSHETLDTGLYVASANIAQNGALSSSNLTADTAGGLNALNSKIANDFGKVLWTNSSPSSNFVDGDLSVPNITNYRVVLIQYLPNKSVPEDYSVTYTAFVGQKGYLYTADTNGVYFRLFTTYANDNKINFQQGGKAGVGFDNQYIIPFKIIGIL